MTHATKAALPVAAGGTVPKDKMLNTHSSLKAVLVGAPAVFADMVDRITHAKEEVLLQTYRWQDDSVPAQELCAALKALEASKPQQPVHVEFILRQGLRERFVGRDAVQLCKLARSLDPRYVQMEVRAHYQWLVGSLHAKSLVVDQKRAVITGANPERPSNPPLPQFDTGYVLRGDIVETLRDDLCDVRADTRVIATNIGKNLAMPPAKSRQHMDRASDTPMLFAARRANGTPGFRVSGNPQNQAFLAAIENAKDRICIITPNLNARPVRRALLSAAQRGVEVNLLLGYKFNNLTERFGQGGANSEVVRKLVRRAKRRLIMGKGDDTAFNHLHIRWFGDGNNRPARGNVPGASHAKGAAFDDHLLAVGSANLDTQSWYHSREINLFIDSGDATKQWLDAVFDPQFARGVDALFVREQ